MGGQTMVKIHTIDLHHQGVPETIASYLVEGHDGLALVETGPGSALEKGVEGLALLGYQPTDIRHVLVTHIHFDHAGAAGWWAAQGAQIYVHHVGAPHLIDPSRLIASAARIYGDQMDVLWGEILPVPEERLTRLFDEDEIRIGDLLFKALDTPGHASHHMTFQLGDVAFTGDIAGVSVPGWRILDIPAPPPEFNLPHWLESLARLKRCDFEAVFPTHFGRDDNVAVRLATVEALVQNAAATVYELMAAGKSRDEILEAYEIWEFQRYEADGLTEHAIHQFLTANPLYMSVDGIMRYWRKHPPPPNSELNPIF